MNVRSFDIITQISSLDRRRREYKKVGWLYVVRNPSFKDPVFKVGMSSRPPGVRLSELSASTAVYAPFEMIYFVHVSDRELAEGQVHYMLRDYRVTPNKEFFEAPIRMIIDAVDRAAEMFPILIGKGRRKTILEQVLGVAAYHCEKCGTENRVKHLLGVMKITCGNCGYVKDIKIKDVGYL